MVGENLNKKIFECTAKKDEQIHELKLNAIDRDDAIRQLKELNFEIVSLEEVKKSTWKIFLGYLLKLRQGTIAEDKNKLANMPEFFCPKCNISVDKTSFAPWQILLAIFFFPIGLITLLLGKIRKYCSRCGYKF